MSMIVDLQPAYLKNEFVTLTPLSIHDFELLYKVASDPLIWEQHPNKDRYRREVFEVFFKGAIESKGAFLVLDAQTNEVIGSSRFYDHCPDVKEVAIGYTFLARDRWGTTYNRALKTLMLEYAFTFADHVIFHIGAQNIRSQKAIEKIGARKTGEANIEYYGEPGKLNFIYRIEKSNWTP